MPIPRLLLPLLVALTLTACLGTPANFAPATLAPDPTVAESAPAPTSPPTPADLSAAADSIVTIETGKTPTNIIYVAPTGSDTTGNGSLGQPYRTLNRAADDATPGTAIRLQPGTYTNASTEFLEDLHGTADNPIWIGGDPGQPRPIIQGAPEAIHLIKPNYVILHNIEVRNNASNGINIDDGGDYADPTAAQYVVLRDLYIHTIGGAGNQDCLKLSGLYHYWILNSEMTACGGDNSGSGIDHVGCHHGVIVGNYIHDTSGNAVQNKGGSTDIEIRANRFINAGQRAINIGGSTGFQFFRPPLSETAPNAEARNIRVIANIFEGSLTPFAFVGAVDSLAAHNVIINPTNWLMRILQETTTTPPYTFLPAGNNTVANNIFYYDQSDLSPFEFINVGDDTAPTTFIFTHNLWYAHTGTPTYPPSGLPVTETNPLHGQNPLFVSVATGDYHLNPGSPAIAYGPRITTFDYDGALYNNPATLGLYEPNPLVFSSFVFLPLLRR